MTILATGTAVTVMTGGAAAPAVVGAVTGTIGGGTAATATAATGAIVGSAATVGGATTGVAPVLAAGAAALGPVGWLALGSTHNQGQDQVTFDCWKPVLHEESPIPSKGKLLNEVISDARIKQVRVNNSSALPEIILENIWDEQFQIKYLALPSGQMTLHAARLN